MTLSEKLFEEFCRQNSIQCERVAVGTGRTPDYDIFPGGMKVVAEVKEITPNKEEIKAQEELVRTGFASGRVTPGNRIRGKISDAGPQIKARSQGMFPGLLVLFDGGYVARHIDSYQIRVAMYGFESAVFSVPQDSQIAPYVIDEKYAGARKMTPVQNTTISAIAALSVPNRETIQIEVFHNTHAAIHLDPLLFARYGVRQYRLGEVVPGQIPPWVEIK